MTAFETPTTVFRDSTDLLSDGEGLVARAETDGYLFFRGLLPRADVLELRAEILEVLSPYGWVRGPAQEHPGTLDADAVAAIEVADLRRDIGVTADAYIAVQKLLAVHQLPHHPALLSLYTALLGSRPFVHPRHIVRMMTSHPAMIPTPVHQDFPLVQGTSRTWTCWFPVGDCPLSMGPLAVLRGSHRAGFIPLAQSEDSDAMYSQLCPGEDEWVSGDLDAGDVLTFPSYTVHRAVRATDRSQIRLSMDVRYQAATDPIEQRSLLPHADCGWDEIYRDWVDERLKYYWATDVPQLVPFDDTLTQAGLQRIC
ncbi:MAG: phytanoyl-CoA dioxygenase family protein [Jatrophihabitans sp.]|uniref:phytanoyl-CoA dioxygenase family protein n=1 Tax=Jatrophihabitans sp. TaxID=1932789 RepID=UPI003F7D91F7